MSSLWALGRMHTLGPSFCIVGEGCQCSCRVHVLAVSLPFSLGTDLSSLRDTNLLRAGKSKPVTATENTGAGASPRGVVQTAALGPANGRPDPAPPLLQPHLTPPCAPPRLSALALENCHSFFKSQHGATSSPAEGPVAPVLAWRKRSIRNPSEHLPRVPGQRACVTSSILTRGCCALPILKMRKVGSGEAG